MIDGIGEVSGDQVLIISRQSLGLTTWSSSFDYIIFIVVEELLGRRERGEDMASSERIWIFGSSSRSPFV
jgi:hypothetical protein